jgi:hypothetical protein
MMKHSSISFSLRRLSTSVLAAAVLAGGASAAMGQTTAPEQAKNTHLKLFVSEPTGKHSTLLYTAGTGWRMQAGWDATAGGAGERPLEALPAEQRPLTVFIDGPTGHAFVYVVDAGWKFVGQIASPDL